MSGGSGTTVMRAVSFLGPGDGGADELGGGAISGMVTAKAPDSRLDAAGISEAGICSGTSFGGGNGTVAGLGAVEGGGRLEGESAAFGGRNVGGDSG